MDFKIYKLPLFIMIPANKPVGSTELKKKAHIIAKLIQYIPPSKYHLIKQKPIETLHKIYGEPSMQDGREGRAR